jgi:alginate O-acetyltransferase complex protein AlgJ
LESRVSDWEDSLTHKGIDVVNLTATLTNAKNDAFMPFLRTDTHWSEQGAEAAAKTVVQKIKILEVTPSPVQITRLDHRTQEIRAGDLVKLAGIDWLPQRLQPLPELAQHSNFKAGPIKSKLQPKRSDDLFGDENLPNIALIGTSFSRQSQFPSYLEMQLNTKIGNFALDGGDFSGSAKAYFSSPSFLDTPPKLIIWEIPERVIEMDRQRDTKIWQ